MIPTPPPPTSGKTGIPVRVLQRLVPNVIGTAFVQLSVLLVGGDSNNFPGLAAPALGRTAKPGVSTSCRRPTAKQPQPDQTSTGMRPDLRHIRLIPSGFLGRIIMRTNSGFSRRGFLRLSGAAGVTVLLPLGSTLLFPGVSYAGTVVDYPEFPYQPSAYTEPYRGQFHFSARGGWMNDINGALYYKGTYHLFYQHNPHGLVWDTMHWGHATSTDLVHWVQKPIALEPGVQPGDLWSGAGVVDANNTSGLRTGIEDPIVVFTGTNGVTVNYSNDAGKTFQSYNHGQPVATPAGTSRDAKVFWHASSSRWVMVVWSDTPTYGVNIYASPNLLTWTFQSRYAASWLFECPDFYPLPVDGNPSTIKWVLNDAGGRYVIGNFDGVTFQPDWTSPQLMDQGRNVYSNGTFYAGQTFNNMPDGRVVQMVWMGSNYGTGWTGNASFPVELGLTTFPEGVRITRTPIAQLSTIRSNTWSWSNRTITTDPASDPLAGLTADTYEIIAEFDLTGATATQFGFHLHARSDGSCDKSVVYDTTTQTLYGAPMPPVNGRVTMHLLVDRGQLEIFGNEGRLSYTDNVNFDSSPTSLGMHLFATGGNVQLVSLQVSTLASTWGAGESTLQSNLVGPWHSVNGTWGDVAGGKEGTYTADAFYLSSQTGADFSYEGDVRVVNGVAAALTFR
ncbi:glycoside hydrolase family 32 protein, partial [Streptomyces sp. NPDC003753]